MIAAHGHHAFGRLRRPRAAAGVALLVLASLVVLVAGLLGSRPTLLRGWLFAFAVWSCIPIGSMTLLLIHRLTGGRWGRAAAPVLRPFAAMMPLVAIAVLPVLTGLRDIYPWASDPTQIKPDVARWYLSEPAFIARSAIALTGWSVLGVTFALDAGGRILAALGLAFFGLMISLVAVDWYLSLEPHYVATAFASMIAIQQLLAALAVVAVISPPQFEGRAVSDIAGLLIATLLGVVYLEYMTYVVAWYGDLPDKAAWFLERSHGAWLVALLASFILGAVLPFALLLFESVRSNRLALRIVGALLLIGTILHLAWLIVPVFVAQGAVVAAGVGVLVVLAIASVLIAGEAASTEVRHAD
ncbi:conserved membrane hypothetical protein [Bradyrhizobium sp. STM 3809]|nr:conserved membrane hypothetical protein [Bradyrhizobium sp. STM 3809]